MVRNRVIRRSDQEEAGQWETWFDIPVKMVLLNNPHGYVQGPEKGRNAGKIGPSSDTMRLIVLASVNKTNR